MAYHRIINRAHERDKGEEAIMRRAALTRKKSSQPAELLGCDVGQHVIKDNHLKKERN